MKPLYIKIMAFLMTILLLFSSSLVIIDEHYCQGKLSSFSIFGKADGCDMQFCNLENQNSSISKSSCCTNVSEIKQGAIFEKKFDTNFNFQPSYFISNRSSNTFKIFNNYIKKNSYFKNYSPPIIFKDLLIFIQCFRI
jgi:hypothetical protein